MASKCTERKAVTPAYTRQTIPARMKATMKTEHWDEMYLAVAEWLVALHTASETGDGGRARVLLYALSGFLDERSILDTMKAQALFMEEAMSA